MKRHFSLFLALLLLPSAFSQQPHTRGLGIYPGRPTEYFGPTLVTDKAQRNLALHRAVYQSSSHDKNLTAQLLTDGEFFTGQPASLSVLRNGKPLSTTERELTLNESEWSSIVLEGWNPTLSYEWQGMEIEADEVVLEGYVAYDEEEECHGYSLQCSLSKYSDDTLTVERQGDGLPGTLYRKRVSSDPNKQLEGDGKPARALKETFSLKGLRRFSYLKFQLSLDNALYWSVKEVTFLKNGQRVSNILPADFFRSVWLTDGPEWAYVDLGSQAQVSDVRLHWAASSATCSVDVSSDAQTWHSAGRITGSKGRTAQLRVGRQCRYVRITTDGPSAIAEMEVYGRGGTIPQPHAEVGWDDSGRYYLNGGSWRLCPLMSDDSKFEPCGPEILATVPATVLSSYYNAGSLPDPNFDDQLSMISESFFHRPFRYRRTFHLPPEMTDHHVLLHFDGINWKADINLNGHRLGRIEGAFHRGEFDISEYLNKDENLLEVIIHPTAHPGSRKTKTSLNTSFNGGVLGADNPTFHATIGWDWITTIPGRNIGIWNDVYLTATEAVSILDPLVQTQLDSVGRATLTPRVFLRNHSRDAVAGLLRGTIGDIKFEKDILLQPLSETEVTFPPSSFPQLCQQQMQLWWPVGYGEPYLYPASYTFVPSTTRRETPVSLNYQTGIREVTYADESTRLQLFINGRRLIPLGGNWGFSENHLNYRGREYDAAVRHHRQMHCNMIRNWVGQTGDEEFYEACDRYGVMVWQDFWLANPVDGPNPDNESMFMANATDYVRRIRRHPSLALFCGRNEGYPPESLNQQLPAMINRLMPGSLYIPSSADDGVSGHGPYQARPVGEYFEKQTGRLHTERGMPNIPEAESMRRMLRSDHLWPQADAWGQHDFTQQGAQAGASFNQILAERFGPLRLRAGQDSLTAYTSLAQWQNYDGYRAMYEAQNTQRQGLLIWMSHPCWPSTVWQTYDYYLVPTAAYYGVGRACEPLHAQWNPLTGMVQLVNLCVPEQLVTIKATIYDLHGSPLWHRSARVQSLPDTTIDCFWAGAPENYSGTYYLSLSLASEETLTMPPPNVYVLSAGTASQEDLFTLPFVQVEVAPSDAGGYMLSNTGSQPALMLHLRLTDRQGKAIEPSFFSDNYFHLMPGEKRMVSFQYQAEDAAAGEPTLHVEGFNVLPQECHKRD